MAINMSQPCTLILSMCTNTCPTEHDDPDAYDKTIKQLQINKIIKSIDAKHFLNFFVRRGYEMDNKLNSNAKVALYMFKSLQAFVPRKEYDKLYQRMIDVHYYGLPGLADWEWKQMRITVFLDPYMERGLANGTIV